MAGRFLPPKIDFPGSNESFDDVDLSTSTLEPSQRQEQKPMLSPAEHIVIHEAKEEPEETSEVTIYFESSYLPFIALVMMGYSASLLLHRSLPADVAFVASAYGIFSCYCLLRWKSVFRYIVPAIFVAVVLGKTVTELADMSIQWEKDRLLTETAGNSTHIPKKVPYFHVMALGLRILVLFGFAFIYDLLGFGVIDHYKPFFRSGYRMIGFIVGWITALTGCLAASVVLLAFTGYVHFE